MQTQSSGCRSHSFLMGSPSGKFLKGFAQGKRTDSQRTPSVEKGVHLGPWFQTSFISTGFYRHHSNPSQRKVRSRFRFGIPFSPKCSHKLFGPWWVGSETEQGLPLGADGPQPSIGWGCGEGAPRLLPGGQGEKLAESSVSTHCSWEFFTCLYSSGHRSLPLDCWASQTEIFLKVSKFVCCHLSFSLCARSLLILYNVHI